MSHHAAWADFPCTVAALTGQVLAVCQQAGRAGTLQGQPRIDERGGTAVMVHKERLQTHTHMLELLERHTDLWSE